MKAVYIYGLLAIAAVTAFSPDAVHLWQEYDEASLRAIAPLDHTEDLTGFSDLSAWYNTNVGSGSANRSLGCWKKTNGRGIGKPLSQCPNADKSGLLCYPFCPSDMEGVGPVCWERCKPGYTNDGVTCRRDVRIYSSDNSNCPWYDICGLTLKRGCSNCNSHPGSKNDGCTCRYDAHIYGKSTKVRGAGWPMSCRADEDQSGALCYPACGRNDSGVGPVCWSTCPKRDTVDCGTFCASNVSTCVSTIGFFSKSGYKAVVAILTHLGDNEVIKGIMQAYNISKSVVDTITAMGWC